MASNNFEYNQQSPYPHPNNAGEPIPPFTSYYPPQPPQKRLSNFSLAWRIGLMLGVLALILVFWKFLLIGLLLLVSLGVIVGLIKSGILTRDS